MQFAKSLQVILFGALLISCSQQSASSSDAAAKGPVERFIVSGSSVDVLETHAKGKGLGIEKKMKFQSSIVVNAPEKEVEEIAKKTGGSFERDSIYSLPTVQGRGAPTGGGTVQPAQSIPWGISKIRANQTVAKGAGIKVCVSDTGISLTHPDLQANIISQVNTINSTKTAQDDNGHGTHVAGTIAAINNAIGVVGVAPEAKLIAAKGLSKSGNGFSSDLAETIDECRVRGAQVINMSWGSSSPNQAIRNALIRAQQAGILLIAAAGNEKGAVIYPAAFPEVIAISAVDVNDAFATFSNFGVEVENSAPGVAIPSTWLNDGYYTISGTSMASPHVAGVAALMLSAGTGAAASDLLGIDIGLDLTKQGSRGRIDAVLTTAP